MFKRKEPKYNIGDSVRFIVYGDTVRIGRIWKIHIYRLQKPRYEIFWNIGFGEGVNYKVCESNIIELLKKDNRKRVSNPFIPIGQMKI